jgi:hypothetical protein
MEMNLAEIRASTLERLDDPSGDLFQQPRLDGLINEAVQDLMRVVDQTRMPWSVAREADQKTVTPVAGTREYCIDTLYGSTATVRRVCEVRDSSGSESSRYPVVPMVNYGQRNSRGAGVYLFRARGSEPQQAMAWHLGLVRMPAAYTSLLVNAVLAVPKLTAPEDVPDEIPPDFHELVSVRAAIRGQMDEKRDWTHLANVWAEGKAQLEDALQVPFSQFTSSLI